MTGDDQGTTPRKLVLQETKTLAGQAIKTILMLCKGMCLRTHSMTELSQNLTKSTLHEVFTRGKYKLEVKEGKSVCSKGMYFWELMIVSELKQIHLSNIINCFYTVIFILSLLTQTGEVPFWYARYLCYPRYMVLVHVYCTHERTPY